MLEFGNGKKGCQSFSFEVLPPLKGRSINRLFENIDSLIDFGPKYINITTHRSELVYKSVSNGLFQRVSERSRPGTVAVAAAIQNRYKVPAVPHIICSGYSALETEYALIDLSFLGITDILLLRGDKAHHESRFVPNENGYSHASELQQQVNRFNEGYFLDGTKMDIPAKECFTYGVAGYPEKHEEAPNVHTDLRWLKHKVDNGASYIVTQMFFDNSKYYAFVDACRSEGINVPIIPGIKPIVTMGQLSLLPKTFKVDLPSELVETVLACKDDEAVKSAGVDWAVYQVRDLLAHGVEHIHFYSHNAVRSVRSIVEQIF